MNLADDKGPKRRKTTPPGGHDFKANQNPLNEGVAHPFTLTLTDLQP
jgi:hypothetical protein